MAGERIVWVGGYPRVRGVNDASAYTSVIKKIEVEEPETVSVTETGLKFVNHDLRAGQLTHTPLQHKT